VEEVSPAGAVEEVSPAAVAAVVSPAEAAEAAFPAVVAEAASNDKNERTAVKTAVLFRSCAAYP
jgi:hypothetical protein